jgi:hypothetical protein
MTEQQKAELIALASVDLEAYIHEYRKALLWLTYGNHKDTPEPTVEDTRELMKELKEKNFSILIDIEKKTQ